MKKTHLKSAWLGYSAVSALAATSVAITSPVWAEGETPFAVAQVLVQLNDTDGDLGFHARIDGDPWKSLIIESPSEQTLLNVQLLGALEKQGLTELDFESAEPTFDRLPPAEFFKRFPEGEYDIEGIALDGRELESTSILSHLIPAAPSNLSVSGVPAPEDCDGEIPVVSEPLVIAWDPVVSSHLELGRKDDVKIDSYEVAVEGESIDYTVNVEADVTQVTLATGAVPSGAQVKYQVLVREVQGNESSSESCFIVQ